MTDDADEGTDESEFEQVRARATEALDAEDLESIYLGLVHADGRSEFYFGNDIDDDELQSMAVQQLGMLTRVLAEGSNATPEEVSKLAVDAAEGMDLQG